MNDLIRGALRCKLPNPRFAYCAPFYSQSKDVAWQYLKDHALVVPGAIANEAELRVDFPHGGRVRLYGTDNYDRLRGLALDGIVLDEPADMDPRAWSEVIRPALSDRQGWATWIGTPKGHNWFYYLVHGDPVTKSLGAIRDPDWFFLELRASETGILDEKELEDARKTMPLDAYLQEYECSFEAAVQGAFYAEELRRAREDGRICRVSWDRYVDVHTAWDLGFTDSTAIVFFQLCGQEIHIIDTYEAAGAGLDHYADVLRGKPYKYGRHYFPHDVQAHELSHGRTREETLRKLGIAPTVVANVSVMDGINAVRRVFDRLWFDEEKTRPLVEALSLYRRDYDTKMKIFKQKPMHDWTSHMADAMRYCALGLPGFVGKQAAVDRYRAKRDRSERTTFMSA